MAIYWPTPGYKGRTFKLCVLTRWDFNFCIRSSPLWGPGKKKQTFGPVCIIHYRQNKTDCKVRELSQSSFSKIKEADEVRKAQGSENERLSDVYESSLRVASRKLKRQLRSENHKTVKMNGWVMFVARYQLSTHRICTGIIDRCCKNFTNVSRILTRKNPSEEDDTSSSKKARTASPSTIWVMLPANRSLLCDKNHEVHSMSKSWSNVGQKQLKNLLKKKLKRNKINTAFWRSRILTSLIGKHIIMPPVGDTPLHRMTDSRQPSKTAKPLKSKLLKRPLFSALHHFTDSVTERFIVERMAMLRESITVHVGKQSTVPKRGLQNLHAKIQLGKGVQPSFTVLAT